MYRTIDNFANIISTHSAREDGDARMEISAMWPLTFQPTPPARTETTSQPRAFANDKISTHSAREDGDLFLSLIHI